MSDTHLTFTRTDSPAITHIVGPDGAYRIVQNVPDTNKLRVRVDQSPLEFSGYDAMEAIMCAADDLFPGQRTAYENGLELELMRLKKRLHEMGISPEMYGSEDWNGFE